MASRGEGCSRCRSAFCPAGRCGRPPCRTSPRAALASAHVWRIPRRTGSWFRRDPPRDDTAGRPVRKPGRRRSRRSSGGDDRVDDRIWRSRPRLGMRMDLETDSGGRFLVGGGSVNLWPAAILYKLFISSHLSTQHGFMPGKPLRRLSWRQDQVAFRCPRTGAQRQLFRPTDDNYFSPSPEVVSSPCSRCIPGPGPGTKFLVWALFLREA